MEQVSGRGCVSGRGGRGREDWMRVGAPRGRGARHPGRGWGSGAPGGAQGKGYGWCDTELVSARARARTHTHTHTHTRVLPHH